MVLERSKNAKRNILFGTINKIVTLIFPFIVRTIIIKKLGSEYLGLSSLFSSILQVLSLTELGFSSAVVFSMYRPIAENDTDTICALMNFYRKVYRIIGCVLIGTSLCLMPLLPYLISGSYPELINIYILYILYIINTALSYFLFAYKSALLNAYQRTDIISNVGTLTQGGMYILQISIISITKNYYFYVLMMPVFNSLNNIINAAIVKRLYPQYVCKGSLEGEKLDAIKKQVSGLMVNKLCQTSRNSFDSIFVSAFLGLTATAIYSNYFYIMNAIIGVISVISSSMLAGVGNSIATETTEKNYGDLKKINFAYMWIAGWCTVCLVCLYQPFMRIWVGKDLMFDYRVVNLFCIYFYILEMGVIRGLYSDAAGLWWKNRYRAIAESIANLVLNFMLVQVLGIYGIIVATLIPLIIINFGFGSQIVFKCYFKNDRLHEYFQSHAKYAIITFCVSIVTYFVCQLVSEEGLVNIVLKGIICCVIPNILYIMIYFRSKEYKESIPWLLDVLHLQNKLRFLLPKDSRLGFRNDNSQSK